MVSVEYDPNQASLTGQLSALIAGLCCDVLFCFDPSTRCRLQQNAFSAELLLTPFWQTIVKPETWRSTSTEPSAEGSASVSHPIDSSHAHTRMLPGFHLNANWLLCYIITGAADRLNKLRLSRPSSGDRQQSPARTCNWCREIQFNDVVKNKSSWTWQTPVRPPAPSDEHFSRDNTTTRLPLNGNTFFAKVSSRILLQKASNFAGTTETAASSDKYFTNAWLRCGFKCAVRESVPTVTSTHCEAIVWQSSISFRGKKKNIPNNNSTVE